MEARHGACASCGAKYKVPATFKADKARCKACGGVVAIGPVQTEQAAAGAAAGAAAAQAVPAKKPAPRRPVDGPVARPVAAKADKPAARPTRARATEVEADESDAAPAKSRTRARASSGKAAASGRRAGGAKRSGARAGKRGAAGDDGAAASPRAGSRGRSAKAKKKSPMPLVAGVAVVVLAAGGGWYVMQDGGGDAAAKETGTTASAPEDPILEDSTTGAEDTGLEASTSGLEDAPAADAAAGDESEPEPEKPAKAKKKADPDSVDLTALVEFGPAPETSPEEWAQYEEWVAAVVDPDSGILGSRARKSLTDTGRPAYPAIVNGMLKLNYASDVHVKSGDRCQTALREILSGNNFGWKYTTSPEDEYFNKKVVVLFHGQWVKAENNLDYWIKMAKLDEDEAAELRAAVGDSVQTPPADDDEELFDIDD